VNRRRLAQEALTTTAAAVVVVTVVVVVASMPLAVSSGSGGGATSGGGFAGDGDADLPSQDQRTKMHRGTRQFPTVSDSQHFASYFDAIDDLFLHHHEILYDELFKKIIDLKSISLN